MLDVVEARVLGVLLEKERTTPDQYPLSLNALLTACNQATSREPVMSLSEHEVQAALTSMKAGGLVRMVHPSHGRSVTRYRQVLDEQRSLDAPLCALMAVLLLRGPQTAAELRTRTERLHPFESLTAVENCLSDAAVAGLVQLLERHPGHKEPRWRQLIADEVEPTAAVASSVLADRMTDRVAELEARVERLEAALADLL